MDCARNCVFFADSTAIFAKNYLGAGEEGERTWPTVRDARARSLARDGVWNGFRPALDKMMKKAASV